ncbi:ras guanine nucleotide exchange factor P-like [Leguminivora glycinivorella]|uniref:ras guanine nucleotide exchange factor P-like n=1 Tax=Leguminivora glycinivorella TaxID=1035111 RepID=UPI00200D837A|nr:ras guanine nucleotide exchange factor P-like [Leguminivora glycinivorella]
MEEDDTDSDRTVLLRDFISKPQKVELKRRRLSELQERGKKPDQSNNENTTPSNVSNNKHFDVPKNNSVGKNWLLTRYFSSIGKPFGAKTLNNASDIQQSDNLRENLPKYAPDSQALNKNTPKSDNDIICLDSDEDIDETLRSENPQNQETNGEVSSRVTKLKVLKPSAFNARTATTIVFETQKMQENEPARLKVLKPSMINARRATTNFEDNVEYNSSNGKENVEREHGNVSNNDNKQIDKDGLRISCRLSPSESNIRNITNSPSSGTNTGTCATQGEDNRTSVVTVANNMSNTDTSDTTIVGKLFQQDAEKNTVSNVKANKRFSNNETKMDSKRIKMNVEPECLIKQHEQVTNKKSQEIAEISESHGEHVSHEEIMNLTNNPARCNENTVNKSIVNSVREESKLKEHVLPGIQDSRKIEDEHVINEAHINVQTSNKELGKQDARNAKNCNPRVEQGSKMQENRDVNKIEDTLNTSKDRVHANDSDAASKVQNQQYSDIHKTSTIQDVITTNEIQVKQKSTNQVHNPTI